MTPTVVNFQFGTSLRVAQLLDARPPELLVGDFLERLEEMPWGPNRAAYHMDKANDVWGCP